MTIERFETGNRMSQAVVFGDIAFLAAKLRSTRPAMAADGSQRAVTERKIVGCG